MFFSTPKKQDGRIRLMTVQKNTVLLGCGFMTWIALSFFINNMEEFDYVRVFLGSAVESLNFLYGFMIFLTVITLANNRERWLNCLNAWLFGAVVVSLVGAWAMLGSAPA